MEGNLQGSIAIAINWKDNLTVSQLLKTAEY